MTDWTSSPGFPATAPNAASLPHAARYRGADLAGRMFLFGGVLILMPAIVAVLLVRDTHHLGIGALALGLVAVGVLILLACLWRLRGPQAVFYADRVEKPGLFGTSVLHRTNIRGVRVVQTRGGSYFELVSSSPAESDISLNGVLRADPVVAEWLHGAPDPDALDRMADRAAILADDRYGGTQAERSSRLDRTGQLILAFNAACVALAVGLALFAPLGPLSMLLAVAPMVAAALIVAACNGLVKWIAYNSVHPQVVGCAAPPVALAARTLMSAHLIGREGLGQAGLMFGVIAVVLVVVVGRMLRGNAWKAVALSVFAVVAACSLVIAANVCLDASPPRIFVTAAYNKHVDHHSRSTTFYIYLLRWSDQPGGDVSVSSRLYDRITENEHVCVTRRKGALAQSWFTVAECPPGLILAAAEPMAGTRGAITDADWIRPPTAVDLAGLYPETARRLNVDGIVALQCLSQANGALTDCQVTHKDPVNFGFDDASLQLAARLRVRPRAGRSTPTTAVEPIAFSIRWMPPQR